MSQTGQIPSKQPIRLPNTVVNCSSIFSIRFKLPESLNGSFVDNVRWSASVCDESPFFSLINPSGTSKPGENISIQLFLCSSVVGTVAGSIKVSIVRFEKTVCSKFFFVCEVIDKPPLDLRRPQSVPHYQLSESSSSLNMYSSVASRCPSQKLSSSPSSVVFNGRKSALNIMNPPLSLADLVLYNDGVDFTISKNTKKVGMHELPPRFTIQARRDSDSPTNQSPSPIQQQYSPNFHESKSNTVHSPSRSAIPAPCASTHNNCWGPLPRIGEQVHSGSKDKSTSGSSNHIEPSDDFIPSSYYGNRAVFFSKRNRNTANRCQSHPPDANRNSFLTAGGGRLSWISNPHNSLMNNFTDKTDPAALNAAIRISQMYNYEMIQNSMNFNQNDMQNIVFGHLSASPKNANNATSFMNLGPVNDNDNMQMSPRNYLSKMASFMHYPANLNINNMHKFTNSQSNNDPIFYLPQIVHQSTTQNKSSRHSQYMNNQSENHLNLSNNAFSEMVSGTHDTTATLDRVRKDLDAYLGSEGGESRFFFKHSSPANTSSSARTLSSNGIDELTKSILIHHQENVDSGGVGFDPFCLLGLIGEDDEDERRLMEIKQKDMLLEEENKKRHIKDVPVSSSDGVEKVERNTAYIVLHETNIPQVPDSSDIRVKKSESLKDNDQNILFSSTTVLKGASQEDFPSSVPGSVLETPSFIRQSASPPLLLQNLPNSYSSSAASSLGVSFNQLPLFVGLSPLDKSIPTVFKSVDGKPTLNCFTTVASTSTHLFATADEVNKTIISPNTSSITSNNPINSNNNNDNNVIEHKRIESSSPAKGLIPLLEPHIAQTPNSAFSSNHTPVSSYGGKQVLTTSPNSMSYRPPVISTASPKVVLFKNASLPPPAPPRSILKPILPAANSQQVLAAPPADVSARSAIPPPTAIEQDSSLTISPDLLVASPVAHSNRNTITSSAATSPTRRILRRNQLGFDFRRFADASTPSSSEFSSSMASPSVSASSSLSSMSEKRNKSIFTDRQSDFNWDQTPPQMNSLSNVQRSELPFNLHSKPSVLPSSFHSKAVMDDSLVNYSPSNRKFASHNDAPRFSPGEKDLPAFPGGYPSNRRRASSFSASPSATSMSPSMAGLMRLAPTVSQPQAVSIIYPPSPPANHPPASSPTSFFPPYRPPTVSRSHHFPPYYVPTTSINYPARPVSSPMYLTCTCSPVSRPLPPPPACISPHNNFFMPLNTFPGDETRLPPSRAPSEAYSLRSASLLQQFIKISQEQADNQKRILDEFLSAQKNLVSSPSMISHLNHSPAASKVKQAENVKENEFSLEKDASSSSSSADNNIQKETQYYHDISAKYDAQRKSLASRWRHVSLLTKAFAAFTSKRQSAMTNNSLNLSGLKVFAIAVYTACMSRLCCTESDWSPSTENPFTRELSQIMKCVTVGLEPFERSLLATRAVIKHFLMFLREAGCKTGLGQSPPGSPARVAAEHAMKHDETHVDYQRKLSTECDRDHSFFQALVLAQRDLPSTLPHHAQATFPINAIVNEILLQGSSLNFPPSADGFLSAVPLGFGDAVSLHEFALAHRILQKPTNKINERHEVDHVLLCASKILLDRMILLVLFRQGGALSAEAVAEEILLVLGNEIKAKSIFSFASANKVVDKSSSSHPIAEDLSAAHHTNPCEPLHGSSLSPVHPNAALPSALSPSAVIGNPLHVALLSGADPQRASSPRVVLAADHPESTHPSPVPAEVANSQIHSHANEPHIQSTQSKILLSKDSVERTSESSPLTIQLPSHRHQSTSSSPAIIIRPLLRSRLPTTLHDSQPPSPLSSSLRPAYADVFSYHRKFAADLFDMSYNLLLSELNGSSEEIFFFVRHLTNSSEFQVPKFIQVKCEELLDSSLSLIHHEMVPSTSIPDKFADLFAVSIGSHSLPFVLRSLPEDSPIHPDQECTTLASNIMHCMLCRLIRLCLDASHIYQNAPIPIAEIAHALVTRSVSGIFAQLSLCEKRATSTLEDTKQNKGDLASIKVSTPSFEPTLLNLSQSQSKTIFLAVIANLVHGESNPCSRMMSKIETNDKHVFNYIKFLLDQGATSTNISPILSIVPSSSYLATLFQFAHENKSCVHIPSVSFLKEVIDAIHFLSLSKQQGKTTPLTDLATSLGETSIDRIVESIPSELTILLKCDFESIDVLLGSYTCLPPEEKSFYRQSSITLLQTVSCPPPFVAVPALCAASFIVSFLSPNAQLPSPTELAYEIVFTLPESFQHQAPKLDLDIALLPLNSSSDASGFEPLIYTPTPAYAKARNSDLSKILTSRPPSISSPMSRLPSNALLALKPSSAKPKETNGSLFGLADPTLQVALPNDSAHPSTPTSRRQSIKMPLSTEYLEILADARLSAAAEQKITRNLDLSRLASCLKRFWLEASSRPTNHADRLELAASCMRLCVSSLSVSDENALRSVCGVDKSLRPNVDANWYTRVEDVSAFLALEPPFKAAMILDEKFHFGFSENFFEQLIFTWHPSSLTSPKRHHHQIAPESRRSSQSVVVSKSSAVSHPLQSVDENSLSYSHNLLFRENEQQQSTRISSNPKAVPQASLVDIVKNEQRRISSLKTPLLSLPVRTPPSVNDLLLAGPSAPPTIRSSVSTVRSSHTHKPVKKSTDFVLENLDDFPPQSSRGATTNLQVEENELPMQYHDGRFGVEKKMLETSKQSNNVSTINPPNLLIISTDTMNRRESQHSTTSILSTTQDSQLLIPRDSAPNMMLSSTDNQMRPAPAVALSSPPVHAISLPIQKKNPHRFNPPNQSSNEGGSHSTPARFMSSQLPSFNQQKKDSNNNKNNNSNINNDNSIRMSERFAHATPRTIEKRVSSAISRSSIVSQDALAGIISGRLTSVGISPPTAELKEKIVLLRIEKVISAFGDAAGFNCLEGKHRRVEIERFATMWQFATSSSAVSSARSSSLITQKDVKVKTILLQQPNMTPELLTSAILEGAELEPLNRKFARSFVSDVRKAFECSHPIALMADGAVEGIKQDDVCRVYKSLMGGELNEIVSLLPAISNEILIQNSTKRHSALQNDKNDELSSSFPYNRRDSSDKRFFSIAPPSAPHSLRTSSSSASVGAYHARHSSSSTPVNSTAYVRMSRASSSGFSPIHERRESHSQRTNSVITRAALVAVPASAYLQKQFQLQQQVDGSQIFSHSEYEKNGQNIPNQSLNDGMNENQISRSHDNSRISRSSMQLDDESNSYHSHSNRSNSMSNSPVASPSNRQSDKRQLELSSSNNNSNNNGISAHHMIRDYLSEDRMEDIREADNETDNGESSEDEIFDVYNNQSSEKSFSSSISSSTKLNGKDYLSNNHNKYHPNASPSTHRSLKSISSSSLISHPTSTSLISPFTPPGLGVISRSLRAYVATDVASSDTNNSLQREMVAIRSNKLQENSDTLENEKEANKNEGMQRNYTLKHNDKTDFYDDGEDSRPQTFFNNLQGGKSITMMSNTMDKTFINQGGLLPNTDLVKEKENSGPHHVRSDEGSSHRDDGRSWIYPQNGTSYEGKDDFGSTIGTSTLLLMDSGGESNQGGFFDWLK